MNETHVTVVGNVVSAISPRTVGADGTLVVSFRMASNGRRRDRVSGEWVDGDQFFVQVSCWRRLAQNVLDCVVTGDPVIVTGRLYTRSYEVEGERRSQVSLEATAVGVELSRHRVVSVRQSRRVGEAAQEGTSGGTGEAGTAEPVPSTGSGSSLEPAGWREASATEGAAAAEPREPALTGAPGAEGA